jgi:exosortase A
MLMNARGVGLPMLPLRLRGWPSAVVAFVVAVVVLLVCYWQTVQSLLWTWDHDGTYQYAFLIFPLSLWTAFSLRRQVRARPPVPSVWGLLAVAGLVFVWYAGRLLDVNLLQHFALVAMFPALVLACWGWRALWVLVFPLGYLAFAVPWGDALVGPLQDITAHIAVRALELTGTPVLLNGREIITPSGLWLVADACSGVKFFIACMALGCLFAYLMFQRWWKRVAFVALSAVAPVIANGLRVYFTVLIGETWGLEYATGTDHMIFGWQFFGTVLVLLLLVGWFFRDRVPIETFPQGQGEPPAGVRSLVWLAAVALLVAGPVVAGSLSAAPPPLALQLAAPSVAGWEASQIVDGWRPAFQGAAGQVRLAYRSAADGDVVELFHAVYTGKPRRGHTLITYGNDLYDPAQSHILSRASPQVALADDRRTAAGEMRLSGATGPRLVWYWYCVGARCTGSPMVTKLLQAAEVLRGHTPQSSVWALSAPVASNVEQARTMLRTFARGLRLQDSNDGAQAPPPADVAGGQP